MLTAAALGFVNHLLAGEDWARARLKPFAGQTARFVCAPLEARCEITAAGVFRPAAASAPAIVV